MSKKQSAKADEMPITFRYISVPYESTSVGGIGLWYKSEEEAKAHCLHFHNYVASSSNTPRACKVSFERESAETHRLIIDISYATTLFRISISLIESEYVRRITNSLASFPFFFIMAGFIGENGQPMMLPPRDYSFFLSSLWVDGRHVRGNIHGQQPMDLFQTDIGRVIEE